MQNCNYFMIFNIFNRAQIFKSQPNLSWQLLEQQCNIYTNPQTKIEQINKLTSLYCKFVEKLNSLEDNRQKYFSYKMQKLMSQPFVIRTYNNFVLNNMQNKDINLICNNYDDNNDLKQNKNRLKNNLDQKRKQLEIKLSLEQQKQNKQSFKHILNLQNQKEKKLKNKINQLIQQHQKKLQYRLQLRMIKQISSKKILSSLSQSTQNNQTYNQSHSQFNLIKQNQKFNQKSNHNNNKFNENNQKFNEKFNQKNNDKFKNEKFNENSKKYNQQLYSNTDEKHKQQIINQQKNPQQIYTLNFSVSARNGKICSSTNQIINNKLNINGLNKNSSYIQQKIQESSQKSLFGYGSRTQSQRFFYYEYGSPFNQRKSYFNYNKDDDDMSSEDEYEIQKRIRIEEIKNREKINNHEQSDNDDEK